MNKLSCNFMYNGYSFVLNGKAESEQDVKRSGYVLTDTDRDDMIAAFDNAVIRFGESYKQDYKSAFERQLQRIKDYPGLMSVLNDLKDVSVNQEGETDQTFLHFDAGTDIIEIWLWIEEQDPSIRMKDFV